MKPRTDQSPENYYLPIAPDGTIKFATDPATGEERIDLHSSSLNRIAQDAINLAEPSHAANPDSIDARRVEFGGNVSQVIDASARFGIVRSPELVDPTHPSILLGYGAAATNLRQAKLDEENNSKAA